MKWDLAVLTAIALAVRTGVALIVPQAPWTDSAYYFASAQRLAAGEGLTLPFVWSFLETGGRLPPDPSLPIHSHAHWMPLTAMVTALGMELFGSSWRGAQAVMILLSTALTPITYLIALDLWRSRPAAVTGSLLVIFSGPLLLFGSIVESYAVFGLVGSLALFAALRSIADQRRARLWLLLSGGLVGVATLTRIEGILLGVATATAWLIGMGWTGWRARGRIGWAAGVASFGLFCLAVAPWAARNVATFGRVLPSTGGHTLWIKDYNEQFSITADTSVAAYLAQGAGPILVAKVGAWLTILGYSLALLGGVFGIFFLAGMWRGLRRAVLVPFVVYWLTMLVVMGGVFTFHAPHGLFYHHAAAWLPIAAPLAAAAVPDVATGLGRWWRFLRRPATHRFLLRASLIGAVLFSLVSSGLLLAEWRANLAAVHAADRFLDANASPDDVVLFRDAPLLTANTGWRAVAPPNDPYPVIEQVARAYGADWYVAQRQSRGPGIEPLGLWEGGRAVDRDGNRAEWLEIDPAYDDGTVRIYRIIPPGMPEAAAPPYRLGMPRTNRPQPPARGPAAGRS